MMSHSDDQTELKKASDSAGLTQNEANESGSLEQNGATESNSSEPNGASQMSKHQQLTDDKGRHLETGSSQLPQKKTIGTAPIKPEYIDHNHKRRLVEQYLPAGAAEQLKQLTADNSQAESSGEPPAKKKKLKGRNKKRPQERGPAASEKLCPAICRNEVCSFGERCKFMHNIESYMAAKPVDLGETCYLFRTYGKCPYALTCRFAGDHTTQDLKSVVNETLVKKWEGKKNIVNILSKDLQKKLWKRTYNFKKAEEAFRAAKDSVSEKRDCQQQKPGEKNFCLGLSAEPKSTSVALGSSCEEKCVQASNTDEPVQSGSPAEPAVPEVESENISETPGLAKASEGAQIHSDGGVIRLRPQEKKKIDFSNKLYLAPLTTVGNLPYRRICKQYGADITCGEMAMATNLLQGQQSEWALLKRHESEDIFGVQVCGSYPDSMARCAQLLTENIDVDFIDINCGCPIDLIFKRGEGCALMGRTTKFEQVVTAMQSVMDVPLTAKIRTGIFENKIIAHTLVPKLRDWSLSLVTIHGRSREQRYTRLADWDYIERCSQAAKPMPIFGNGDILSYEDAVAHRAHTSVSGLMVARGALIKPWVFTEIKEERHWDISSSERLDMLRQYTNYGLDHWGSDHQGVASTRRFLLEWLSFLHRYIPVGLLERLPQNINEKPPYYFGRDDLETLMASGNCADWVKITEMLLGPVPDGFAFLPKHRANSYS